MERPHVLHIFLQSWYQIKAPPFFTQFCDIFRAIQMILDTAMNDTRAKVLICIFLIVATFCIYSQVQDHKFINFDDDIYIPFKRI